MQAVYNNIDEAFAAMCNAEPDRRIRERISTALELIRAGAAMLRGQIAEVYLVGASREVVDQLVRDGADASMTFERGEHIHVRLAGGPDGDVDRVDVTACRKVNE